MLIERSFEFTSDYLQMQAKLGGRHRCVFFFGKKKEMFFLSRNGKSTVTLNVPNIKKKNINITKLCAGSAGLWTNRQWGNNWMFRQLPKNRRGLSQRSGQQISIFLKIWIFWLFVYAFFCLFNFFFLHFSIQILLERTQWKW